MIISDFWDFVSNARFVSVAGIQGKRTTSVARQHAKDMFFAVAMAFYLKTLHEIAMNAWQKFAETEKQIAKDSHAAHRFHEEQRAELEGQRQQIENKQQAREGEIIGYGTHRQVDKFHFHEGQRFDHLHLHIAV